MNSRFLLSNVLETDKRFSECAAEEVICTQTVEVILADILLLWQSTVEKSAELQHAMFISAVPHHKLWVA